MIANIQETVTFESRSYPGLNTEGNGWTELGSQHDSYQFQHFGSSALRIKGLRNEFMSRKLHSQRLWGQIWRNKPRSTLQV